MKNIFLALALIFFASQAQAQSTANQVINGGLTTAGCSGSISPCFVPYGPLAVSQTSAAATSLIIKASPGQLYSLSVTSSSAGNILLFNQATVPGTGAVTPYACYSAGVNTTTTVPLNQSPLLFSTGIVAVFSSATSCFTYTASSTAFIAAQYQ